MWRRVRSPGRVRLFEHDDLGAILRCGPPRCEATGAGGDGSRRDVRSHPTLVASGSSVYGRQWPRGASVSAKTFYIRKVTRNFTGPWRPKAKGNFEGLGSVQALDNVAGRARQPLQGLTDAPLDQLATVARVPLALCPAHQTALPSASLRDRCYGNPYGSIRRRWSRADSGWPREQAAGSTVRPLPTVPSIALDQCNLRGIVANVSPLLRRGNACEAVLVPSLRTVGSALARKSQASWRTAAISWNGAACCMADRCRGSPRPTSSSYSSSRTATAR
jgi:hypothetical protein